ncbi:hypothetical protein [Blastococcus sp. PRF04-17]|uniref:hypothetical protein n=1 Tax=Blastococcus sp. PRF04-17 TaxID=2933797 RepID=UPI001FF1BBE2|nr:hypothetical protein [Blastococcus sp. PRF04-17]UOY00975.1 hypothetical protein MVA48_18660 [Blastococcus sp. PRF04-17]
MTSYVEPGGSWRTFSWVAGALVGFVVLDLVLPGGDLPPVLWVLAVAGVLGVVGLATLSARRIWTVRVDSDALSVGRERVRLSDVDIGHLRAVDSGVDAGAPVLGGGWSLPKGRTGLPLKLDDGRTVLVPTRNPAALYEALMVRLGQTPDTAPGAEGTLGA